jgi:hypothetical protein
MATVTTPTSTANSAASELSRIEREVKRIQAQLDLKNSGKEIQEFQKDSRDVKVDTNATARDIGRLQENTSRLNVFSALSSGGDSVDVYRFKVITTAKTTIGVLNESQDVEGKLRYQVFNKATGRIVADSGDDGEARQNWEALRDGNFELNSGDYVLRVSRATNVGPDRDKEFSYALQINQGTYKRDYDTIERAARDTDDPFGGAGVSEATTSLTNSIASSVTFMQNLPKIGTSATDKLMGLFISSVA